MKGSGSRHRTSLRNEVRDALLDVLRDKAATPTARAIAGRSLVQLLGEDEPPKPKSAPANELSIEELDEEIARLEQPSNQRSSD